MAIGDVAWDVTTKRPIVDGKTINPDTGAVQPASTPTTYGPPTIDIVWQNLHTDPQADVWVLNRGPAGPSIDELFIRVAKLVQDQWITLHSVTVTQYTCVVVCESKMTRDEFHRVAWNFGEGSTVLH
ncbi:hypothetical protein B0A48_10450 [Cryoendolithus antarcticus]|uniref:Uncharacterized protein n=1 Tax=Cryoendolithus antarcticus TaxID=1507870 RepID=A0A1V8SXM3_9PEZI|nr:hypothetical protein B0A48_10450 [Cryoendolithus antarcticus]